jgi:hypothetical protein
MHAMATPMLTTITRSGPVRCARRPAKNGMNSIGRPNRLSVAPMKSWLASRSASSTAQFASKTPIVRLKASPVSRLARTGRRASRPRSTRRACTPGEAGSSARSASGASSSSSAAGAAKGARRPPSSKSSEATTGPARKPPISKVETRPRVWPARAGSRVTAMRRRAGAKQPEPSPSSTRAAVNSQSRSATVIPMSPISAEASPPSIRARCRPRSAQRDRNACAAKPAANPANPINPIAQSSNPKRARISANSANTEP